MQLHIRDFILEELNNNEISELLLAVIHYIRSNVITNSFSNKTVKLAYRVMLSDINDAQIAIEKKNKRAEINRQNALKRWNKSVDTNCSANTMQSHMQNVCKKNAIADAKDMQKYTKEIEKVLSKLPSTPSNPSSESTTQEDMSVDAETIQADNANNMQTVCKNNANEMQNNFAENTDNTKEIAISDNAKDMQNLCEENAKIIQTECEENRTDMQEESPKYAKKSLKTLLANFKQRYDEEQAAKETSVLTMEPAEEDEEDKDTEDKKEIIDNIDGMKSIGSLLKGMNLPKVNVVDNKDDINTDDMQTVCESDAIAYANGNAKNMQTECENNANEMQNVCEKNASEMQDNNQDNTSDNVVLHTENPFDIIRKIERESRELVDTSTFKSEYEIYAESYAKKYNNNMQNVCECNANGYANSMQNDANGSQAASNINNSENSISTSNLTSSSATEKSFISSVDDLLNQADKENYSSVQKIKEKEKRTKKEKENIYNNYIYNNKYINNNIFKEEKENLIKEKEESNKVDSKNSCVNEKEEGENTFSKAEKEDNVTQEEYKLSEQVEPKSKRFKAPTVDEVRAYVLEKRYNVDAEAFVDYYTSKGWVVGKSPMKDWRAAVRTWNKNNARFNSSAGGGYYANNKPNRMMTPNEREAAEYADKLCQQLVKAGVLTEENCKRGGY